MTMRAEVSTSMPSTYREKLPHSIGAEAGVMEDRLLLDVGTDSSLTICSDGLRICGQLDISLFLIPEHPG